MPLYVSVGNFKLQYMESLRDKGFELFAAYGNTGTDVRAYEAAGIPKSRHVHPPISPLTAAACGLVHVAAEHLMHRQDLADSK